MNVVAKAWFMVHSEMTRNMQHASGNTVLPRRSGFHTVLRTKTDPTSIQCLSLN